ncbi:hypothetical protein ACF8O8_19020 [Pseudomonas sp. TYF_14]|uniref:hypothetical protein n=1 Tax=Pseudomonas sp. TYF_14 TaxID=3367193 RepID=UPI00370C4F2B
MKNPYAFGFWCLAIVLVLLTTTFILSVPLNKVEMSGVLTHVSAWSAAIQGIASIILVVFAILGFSTWKAQIKHEKVMSVIWTTQASLHRVDIDFQTIMVELSTSGVPFDLDVTTFLSQQELGSSLKELHEQCVWMDRIVTENGWEWVNHAGFLKGHVISYISRSRGSPSISDRLFCIGSEQSAEINRAVNGFKSELAAMERKLKELNKSHRAWH